MVDRFFHFANFGLKLILLFTRDLIVVVPALSKVDLEIHFSLLKFFLIRIQFFAELPVEVYDVLTDFTHFEVIFLHVSDAIAD
jgi:hypothetical protein